MRKIILASHHNLAAGMKDTLEYIIPTVEDITAVSAYTNNVPVDEEIDVALAELTEKDEAIIFTDLLGGSVTQNFIKYLAQPNVHLVAGMNLPVIMSGLLSLGEAPINPDQLRMVIQEGQQQIVYVNDYIAQQTIDEDDE